MEEKSTEEILADEIYGKLIPLLDSARNKIFACTTNLMQTYETAIEQCKSKTLSFYETILSEAKIISTCIDTACEKYKEEKNNLDINEQENINTTKDVKVICEGNSSEVCQAHLEEIKKESENSQVILDNLSNLSNSMNVMNEVVKNLNL